MHLTGVLVIPSITKNIIIGSKLVQGNMQQVKVIINNQRVQIINDNDILYMLYNPVTQLWYMNGTRMDEKSKNLHTINNLNIISRFHTKKNIASVTQQNDISNSSKKNKSDPSQSRKIHKIDNIDINEAHQKFRHLNEKVLKSSLAHYGYHATGSFVPCHACMMYKAQQKSVNKITTMMVTKPGERLHIDTSGPFPTTLGGNKYWIKIKDQYSGMSWNTFVKERSSVTSDYYGNLDH